MLYLIAEIAIEMGVDGHRADLIMMKAAKTMQHSRGVKRLVRRYPYHGRSCLVHRMAPQTLSRS